MKVRAKFRVDGRKQEPGNPTVGVSLFAVTADGIPEHERFHQYTPNGSINLTIDNPSAAAEFVVGRVFNVDFDAEVLPEG